MVRFWLVESAWGEDLHIVVERCVSIFVFVEEAVCIVHAEIFEVEKTVWIVLAYELHEPAAL